LTQTNTTLSVVIPVRNEAENVTDLHAELIETLRSLGQSAEIIFVNDASTDGTLLELQLAGQDRRSSDAQRPGSRHEGRIR
jgi:glycosyltransferase involved in cell wall biosynthesis